MATKSKSTSRAIPAFRVALKYPSEVFWSDEDEGFIAVAPDLPGCSAFGDSAAEAITELQDAITSWIEAARNAGNEIPLPSTSAAASNYSGKFITRVPRTLHRGLAVAAKEDNVSLNLLVTYFLSDSLARRGSKIKESVEEPTRWRMLVGASSNVPVIDRDVTIGHPSTQKIAFTTTGFEEGELWAHAATTNLYAPLLSSSTGNEIDFGDFRQIIHCGPQRSQKSGEDLD